MTNCHALKMQAADGKMRLTDEWKRRGIEDEQKYAVLTNIIYRAWSGMSAGEYKRFKGLKKQNLRDNMTNVELILSMLAEESTKEISQSTNPR